MAVQESASKITNAINAITAPAGYQAGATIAGIKDSGLPDLALLISDQPATAAAMYTTNVVKAAPLIVNQAQLVSPQLQAVIVNSGNANCATGDQGILDAKEMVRLASLRAKCPIEDVFVNSTGIIGHFLPMGKIALGVESIELSHNGGSAFAEAILTTDTFLKEAVTTFEVNNHQYTIGACCKGAGMIHPNMATMLAFITTDAPIEAKALDSSLRTNVERSFNMVTIDGDTSTNDTVLAMANGIGDGPIIDMEDKKGLSEFNTALWSVCRKLAIDLARDGEGATKLIEMRVTGAANWEEGRDVARSVVQSPLLKAALSKGDPNWGRVLMAAGYSGVEFDPSVVRLWMGDQILFQNGISTGTPASEAAQATAGDTVKIHLDLGQGNAEAIAWGCDLTEEYVRFNADYVT